MSSPSEPKKPDAPTEPKLNDEVAKDGEIAEENLEEVVGGIRGGTAGGPPAVPPTG